MKDKFGEEWSKLLGTFLITGLNNIGNQLNKEYLTKNVIPYKGSSLYFKAFKDLQPSNIKVIMIGLDPYHNIEKYGPVYTGYAFDNANSLKLSPSLRNIFKEIDRTFPENEFNLDYGGLDRWDLSRWVKQGVFLINTALSVVEGVPGSHTELWRPFTEFWIHKFSKNYNDVIWLLMGAKAQAYEDHIENPTHRIIKTGHPSPLNRTNPFVGSNCFIECNKDLAGRNKTEIVW